jgi:hypothetical protein
MANRSCFPDQFESLRQNFRVPEQAIDPPFLSAEEYEANCEDEARRNQYLEALEHIDGLVEYLTGLAGYEQVIVGEMLLRDQLEREYEEANL